MEKKNYYFIESYFIFFINKYNNYDIYIIPLQILLKKKFFFIKTMVCNSYYY